MLDRLQRSLRVDKAGTEDGWKDDWMDGRICVRDTELISLNGNSDI